MIVTDPVCGMQIDPQKAVGTVEHDGVTYWLCSEACKRRFELEPSKYAPKASA